MTDSEDRTEGREPDIDDDPRQQGTGQGYPESNPAGQTPKEGTDEGPEAGTGGGREQGGKDAPDTSAGQDSSPSKATGNPGAAGG
ncbi:MAG TPA: hypothetical protein VN238_10235 [Solirubrobacteraceae bacterium]|nr:hypothetical protein [Solirubrobacteraceae bacterium]